MAIEVNGKIYRNLPEQVEENANQIEDLKTLFSTLGTVMVYKGSVATYADLPADDNKIGDVWNVIDTGSNYAWDGEDWDEIGSTVDLSGLVTLDTDQTITGSKTIINDVYFKNSSSTTTPFRIQSTNDYQMNFTRGTAFIANFHTSNGFKINANFQPYNNNDVDLGTSSLAWKDLYLSGTAYISTLEDASSISFKINGTERFKLQGAEALTGRMYPSISNTFDLGTNSLRYKDLYLSGTAYISTIKVDSGTLNINWGTSNSIVLGQYSTRFASDILPVSNAVANIGANTTNYMWTNIYLKGVISDGTNSVAVADLAWKEVELTSVSSVSGTLIITGFYSNTVVLASGTIPAGTKEVIIELISNNILTSHMIDMSGQSVTVYLNGTFSASDITHIWYR